MHQKKTRHTKHKMHSGQQSPQSLPEQDTNPTVNVNKVERIISGMAGAFLILRSVGEFTPGCLIKLFAGGALMYRGVTGHCNVYEAMQFSSAQGLPLAQDEESEETLPQKKTSKHGAEREPVSA